MTDIELVIKISEDDLNTIKYLKSNGWASRHELLILDGTPLPKGHKRLIEDNFDVGPVFDEEGHRTGYKYVTQEDLDNAPTIIESDKTESEDK